MPKTYYAHTTDSPNMSGWQLLRDHLDATAKLCSKKLGVIGCRNLGYVLGLLHDLGKYSEAFQDYLKLPEAEQKAKRGKVPHAYAGAHACAALGKSALGKSAPIELPAMVILAHHTGLYDFLSPNGDQPYKTAFDGMSEKYEELEKQLPEEARAFLTSANEVLKSHYKEEIVTFCRRANKIYEPYSLQYHFSWAMLTRFLYSALIDADRSDSAGYIAKEHAPGIWEMLIDRFETYNKTFPNDTPVDKIRATISEQCQDAAEKAKGIYRLTLPTGSGKTLSSLRFALHHAQRYKMKRIVYAAAFCAVLEQNAQAVRHALNDKKGEFVFEHHSNLASKIREEEEHRRVEETWDSPIVYTTFVQFLNAFFSGESACARRFSALAESVIILDELQSIPIQMFFILCNALNFLKDFMGCTIILSTATQPDLSQFDSHYVTQDIGKAEELIASPENYFEQLKRVHIREEKIVLQTAHDYACYAQEKAAEQGDTLLIVNTRNFARDVYNQLDSERFKIFHLSTNMCARHRQIILYLIRRHMRKKTPKKTLIVVSTSLIEAGVDLSFCCVLRMCAGLDSIAQAAGRCNRHGEKKDGGHVYILKNPPGMKIPAITQTAASATESALYDYEQDPQRYANNLVSPEIMRAYYARYFLGKEEVAQYPVQPRNEAAYTLTDILSINKSAEGVWAQQGRGNLSLFRSAWRTAGEAFEVIETMNCTGVFVPYGKRGRDLCAQLYGCNIPAQMMDLLKQCQRYSVNVYNNVLEQMVNNAQIRLVNDIYVLCEENYHADFGLIQQEDLMQTLIT